MVGAERFLNFFFVEFLNFDQSLNFCSRKFQRFLVVSLESLDLKVARDFEVICDAEAKSMVFKQFNLFFLNILEIITMQGVGRSFMVNQNENIVMEPHHLILQKSLFCKPVGRD